MVELETFRFARSRRTIPMTEALSAVPAAMRVIDGRGSYDPGPLVELISAAHEGWVGETIAVRSTERDEVDEILSWVEDAGHGLIGLYERHGFDEVIVEIRH
jgi:TusA-related sulfurtransferase